MTATKKAATNGRCLSSVHHPFIDQRCPFRKADAKVDTFFTSTKYFTNFFSKKSYAKYYKYGIGTDGSHH